MPTRKEMFEAIKADYGAALLDEHINLVLDLYEKNPEFIERLCKEEKKKCKRVPEPKTRLTVEELDALNQKFIEEEKVILKENKFIIQPCEEEYEIPKEFKPCITFKDMDNVVHDKEELQRVIEIVEDKDKVMDIVEHKLSDLK